MGLFGSIVGGLDKALGIGKVLGLNDERREEMIQGSLDQANLRTEDINQLIGQLQQQAQGQGPSLAQAQLERAGQQAMNQQQALAAGARPGQGGLAQRLAQQNTSRVGADLGQQAALLRLKEQMDARNALQNLLLQARGQSLGQMFGAQGLETTGGRIIDTGGQIAAMIAGGGAGGAG